eukprot:scaffold4823_cov98-Isochrysis_galbana.AAC.7
MCGDTALSNAEPMRGWMGRQPHQGLMGAQASPATGSVCGGPRGCECYRVQAPVRRATDG